MAAVLIDHPVASSLRHSRDGGTNVADAVAHLAGLNSRRQTLPGNLHQLLVLWLHLANHQGDGGVADVAVQVDSHINGNQIALLYLSLLGGNSVDYLVVDRDTGGTRKIFPVPGGLATMGLHILQTQVIDILGGHACHHLRNDILVHLCQKSA